MTSGRRVIALVRARKEMGLAVERCSTQPALFRDLRRRHVRRLQADSVILQQTVARAGGNIHSIITPVTPAPIPAWPRRACVAPIGVELDAVRTAPDCQNEAGPFPYALWLAAVHNLIQIASRTEPIGFTVLLGKSPTFAPTITSGFAAAEADLNCADCE